MPSPVTPPHDLLIEPIVRAALLEDLGGAGDLTTEATVPAGLMGRVQVSARAEGRVAGLAAARLAFSLVDPRTEVFIRVPDGADVGEGSPLAEITGPARALLTAERVALNLAGRLCGIATLTRAFVRAVEGTGAKITCTRKTTPGLRVLEKHAVRCGGGVNHRFGLDDAILIKDNHIAAAGGLGAAVSGARARAGHMCVIEVEVDTLDQLDEALALGVERVLLDNFALDDLRAAVARTKGRAVLEASGGVTLATVRAIAGTGVDYISAGALTHSAPALDLGLDWIEGL